MPAHEHVDRALGRARAMTFGIDYDGVWNATPELWRAIVGLMLDAGHEVILVTARKGLSVGAMGVHGSIDGLIPILFTAGDAKAPAAKRAGYSIDVWIDDNPAGICEGWSSRQRKLGKSRRGG